MVKHLDPPWWSEHIAFTRAGGVAIGHLAPVPFNDEALEVLCRNIETARGRINAPLILENITYHVQMPGAAMSEGAFLNALVARTGCGLLLDVTNLHTNAVNHGYDARRFLDELPTDSVVQLHFAGGHTHDGMLVDSHSGPVTSAVWDLLDEVLARYSVKGAILERDDHLPPFAELADDVARVRALGRKHGRWT